MTNQTLVCNSKNNFGEIIPHIVQTACNYKSLITFEFDNKRVNAKSIMGVMALAGTNANHLDVTADGPDEVEALHAIADLFS